MYERYAKNITFYYNNNSSSSTGSLSMVSHSISSVFHIQHKIFTIGATHSLTFTHPSPIYPSFQCYNIYLPAGAGTWLQKENQLKLLQTHPKADYSFLNGDWNFVENDSDSLSGTRYYRPNHRFSTFWSLFKDSFNIYDIHQAHFTRLRSSDPSPPLTPSTPPC